MHPREFLLRAAALAVAFAVLAPAVAMAHAVVTIGPYSVAIGWAHEPTYVGEQNAVQVIVKDASGTAVNDLTADDLKVVVSTAGQTSDQLALEPAYDADTGLGTPGDYEASLIPTTPGDYTFHVTGSIHGTAVNETVTSGDQTFDTVVDATSVQFPNKEPALGDVVTRVTQQDSRITDAASQAAQASSDASRALVVGGVLGGIGILLGLIGIAIGLRASRRTS